MTKQTYFLGGTSPEGFRTKFKEQILKPGFYTYILKGGPGTGKSTLMKKVAEAFSDHPVSLYYCSSDTRSLDAVVIEDKKIIIADGTAPHIFEAAYPGASQEIINLGEFWNGGNLKKHSMEIHRLFDENLRYHDSVRAYIRAAAAFNSDIYSTGENALKTDKLDGYISRLCLKSIPKKKDNSTCEVDFKQIAAFTDKGYTSMPLIGEYSIYIINDDLFAGSDYFLRAVCEFLCEKGHDVTVSESTMHNTPVFEHIFSESAGIAFMTSTFMNRLEIPSAAVINFSRFYDKEIIAQKKQRLSFDRKAVTEIFREASDTLKEALSVHDMLEKNYVESINFEKMSDFTDNLIKKMKK